MRPDTTDITLEPGTAYYIVPEPPPRDPLVRRIRKHMGKLTMGFLLFFVQKVIRFFYMVEITIKPVKALGYCRVSSITGHPEESLETQEKQIRAYCEARGWQVARVFSDMGKSGASIDRPEYRRMMQAAERGDGTLVICSKLDRFSRSTRDCLNALANLKAWNVGFCSVSESIDTSSPYGNFVFQIFSAVSELERSSIRARLEGGLAAARAKGKHIGRPKKVIDPVQLKKLYTENKLSYTALGKFYSVSKVTILNHLKAQGILGRQAPFRQKNRPPWQPSAELKKILDEAEARKKKEQEQQAAGQPDETAEPPTTVENLLRPE